MTNNVLAFYGMKPNLRSKVLGTTSLDLDKVLVIATPEMLRGVDADTTIIVCGLKYANELGIRGKLVDLKHKEHFSPYLKRVVFVTTAVNSYVHNPNAIPEFLASITQFTTGDLGINYNPTYEVISVPSELGVPENEDAVLVFDIETTGLNFFPRMIFPTVVDKVLFAVFAYELDHSFMIEASDFTLHKELWQEFFHRTDIKFVAHNGKFDVKAMNIDLGISVHIDVDTLMAHHRITGGQKHGLKHLLQVKYGFPNYDKALDKYIVKHPVTGEKWFGDIPREVFYQYASSDAVGTLRLAMDLYEEMDKLHMVETFMKYDMPFLNALASNEILGRYIDMDYLMEKRSTTVMPAIQMYERDVKAITHKMINSIGLRAVSIELYAHMSKVGQKNPIKYVINLANNLNVKSPKQLGMMFILLRMPNWKPSDGTSKVVVERLETVLLGDVQRDFLTALIAHRTSEKIRSSYIDTMIKQVSPKGVVYPTYNQAGTVVFRTSAKSPAIQTIPKSTLGGVVRSAFSTQGDEVIVKLDGSGSQLRIAASLSSDLAMLDVFKDSDGDMHAKTLSSVLKYMPQEYKDNPAQARTLAKGANFALLFLGTKYALRRTMPYVESKVITLLYESFYDTYHQYVRWTKEKAYTAHKNLVLYNKFGYRRVWSGITKQLDNQASNFVITSVEANVMNNSYARVTNELGLPVVLHLHDELQILATKDTHVQVAQDVGHIMLEEYQKVGLNISWAVDGRSLLRWLPLDESDVLCEHEFSTQVGVGI